MLKGFLYLKQDHKYHHSMPLFRLQNIHYELTTHAHIEMLI